ncbi:MAG: hypothetical protein ACHREM_03455 [Polyangiales bacterium]
MAGSDTGTDIGVQPNDGAVDSTISDSIEPSDSASDVANDGTLEARDAAVDALVDVGGPEGACSQPTEDVGTGDGSSTADAEVCPFAHLCGDLSVASISVRQAIVAASAPIGVGGSLLSGKYRLTAAIIYTAACDPSRVGATFAEELDVLSTPGHILLASAELQDTCVTQRSNNVTESGNTLSISEACGPCAADAGSSCAPVAVTYTAAATSLKLFIPRAAGETEERDYALAP